MDLIEVIVCLEVWRKWHGRQIYFRIAAYDSPENER